MPKGRTDDPRSKIFRIIHCERAASLGRASLKKILKNFSLRAGRLFGASLAQNFLKKNFERVGGIGPPYSDWQPDALPLCYTRLRFASARQARFTQSNISCARSQSRTGHATPRHYATGKCGVKFSVRSLSRTNFCAEGQS